MTKDSGEREVFPTGAQRDSGGDKSAPLIRNFPSTLSIMYGFVYDRENVLDTSPVEVEDSSYGLVPDLALNRLQALFERGALKYGENNWERGIPLQRYYESMIRHLIQAWAGDTGEDHLAAVMWNAAAIIQTEDDVVNGLLPKELGDAGALKYNNADKTNL